MHPQSLGVGQSETFKSTRYPDSWISRNLRRGLWGGPGLLLHVLVRNSSTVFEDGECSVRSVEVCALAAIPSWASPPSFQRTEALDWVH
jgi:hypothetical protein